MTELRRRMDDDMLVRGFADRTRESYLWAVTGLARFYRRLPDHICAAAAVQHAAAPPCP
jgi:integrase/recombinase XerD